MRGRRPTGQLPASPPRYNAGRTTALTQGEIIAIFFGGMLGRKEGRARVSTAAAAAAAVVVVAVCSGAEDGKRARHPAQQAHTDRQTDSRARGDSGGDRSSTRRRSSWRRRRGRLDRCGWSVDRQRVAWRQATVNRGSHTAEGAHRIQHQAAASTA